ncbi:MAG: hypothetical protein ACLQU4_17320 [Limisphaerales bacterium]
MNTTEIDIAARRKAAEIYRHFAAGLVTNDQMEDSLPKSFESGLHDIFFWGIWPLYDDLHEHRLTGRYRLTPEGRDHLARIILFLHSSLPYRWPSVTGWRDRVDMLVGVLTLGLHRPFHHRFRASGGDESVWPFFTHAEYESALVHPPFLHAANCA